MASELRIPTMPGDFENVRFDSDLDCEMDENDQEPSEFGSTANQTGRRDDDPGLSENDSEVSDAESLVAAAMPSPITASKPLPSRTYRANDVIYFSTSFSSSRLSLCVADAMDMGGRKFRSWGSPGVIDDQTDTDDEIQFNAHGQTEMLEDDAANVEWRGNYADEWQKAWDDGSPGRRTLLRVSTDAFEPASTGRELEPLRGEDTLSPRPSEMFALPVPPILQRDTPNFNWEEEEEGMRRRFSTRFTGTDDEDATQSIADINRCRTAATSDFICRKFPTPTVPDSFNFVSGFRSLAAIATETPDVCQLVNQAIWIQSNQKH
ncbi:hypothetical protein HDU96_001258 [Phlyctochytrium bullatum]|nr:hypothetical protein HDU96_001258 [Phlyctochytrium bullatum]